jgi:hypothetical protein
VPDWSIRWINLASNGWKGEKRSQVGRQAAAEWNEGEKTIEQLTNMVSLGSSRSET